MTNPNPPREWWIWCKDIREQRIAGVDTGDDGCHVIEYSVYAEVRQEREIDRIDAAVWKCNCLRERKKLGEARKERDEARAETARHKDEAEFWKRSHKTLQEAANAQIKELEEFESQCAVSAQAITLLKEQAASLVSALEDMLEHICDGGGERPCSQVWFQDVAEEMLAKLKASKGAGDE